MEAQAKGGVRQADSLGDVVRRREFMQMNAHYPPDLLAPVLCTTANAIRSMARRFFIDLPTNRDFVKSRKALQKEAANSVEFAEAMRKAAAEVWAPRADVPPADELDVIRSKYAAARDGSEIERIAHDHRMTVERLQKVIRR